MPRRMIQVGTGGWGGVWCREFLPPHVAQGVLEVVAAVDINSEALSTAREHLGLRADQCYTDARMAFDENRADFCVIAVPPAHHEMYVDLAIEHGMHILSEKPIADTLGASVRIAEKVARSGIKMAVTMSHRFDADKTTLRREIRSGEYGKLDYLACRFTCDCRKFASWGKFRHEMPDPLLIEGAVHHLDILADLADSHCESIYAETWNPAWGQYAGDSQAMVTMRMENSVRALYEGAKCNSIGLNGWTKEYIRAECEGATLILDARNIEVFPHDSQQSWHAAALGQGSSIPLLEQRHWANTWLVAQFVEWLSGGPPMETEVQRNLQSVAMVFAAIESSRSGKPVRVRELLAIARKHERVGA